MKTKKLTPLQAAPVQRETVTNASTADANAIAPARAGGGRGIPMGAPFAGDDAE
ncbi:MAG: anacyclamide/piricyclamide family prenylated cyclic peptide [Moorea sp. SIO3I7]|nr:MULTISPECIES: anacyclamide/piricyclamide family prenylated cyclic peptide [Moorena]NEO00705.1 anacyclamide/piricyclamide family prenylated cyclic peptide [Moorena sp. SIO3I7]NEO48637.1 anacyclamide/piricyclamide family prenylated cyclic peptide [Moorena sp. SIO4A3]NEO17135.1 anacyclamide/piricyclamide family prenylated cyclic peptide [Moorena sp. SIO3E8]NEO39566.1 anacyclamide/piricyclamide family prenylated cyclic peptide [Moorena sp. SIOASIH]NEP27506.1 anacyclamide/piricyclamide family pr